MNDIILNQDQAQLLMILKNDIDIINRRIYLFDDIEAEAVSKVTKTIQFFSDKDRTLPIEIYLRSDGGIAEDMFALYDTIRQSEAPIHIIGIGCIASAAVLILAAGHVRFATENAWLMHHLSKSYSEGDEREIESQAEAYKRLSERTYQLLAKHTKKSAKVWEQQAKKKGEVWLDAKEMLEWGIIDEIIPSNVKLTKNKRRKTPKKKINTTSD